MQQNSKVVEQSKQQVDVTQSNNAHQSNLPTSKNVANSVGGNNNQPIHQSDKRSLNNDTQPDAKADDKIETEESQDINHDDNNFVNFIYNSIQFQFESLFGFTPLQKLFNHQEDNDDEDSDQDDLVNNIIENLINKKRMNMDS